MTPSEADTVLAQWAIWAFDDIASGYAIGSWQKDYRTVDWDDGESIGTFNAVDRKSIARGDEDVMQRADAALSRLGRSDAHNAHVLRARYRFGHHFTRDQLVSALNLFCDVYEILTSDIRVTRVATVERFRSP